MIRCRRFATIGLAILLVSLPGCSPDPGIHSGTVSFEDGEPVQSGSIEFRSLRSGARYAGRIEPDGSFRLTDLQGRPQCPPDQYEVVVVQIVLTEDLAAEDHHHGHTVPRRYADYATSDLRVTKSDGQTEPLRVVLQSDASTTP